MGSRRAQERVAWGFSVHTGWTALVAVVGRAEGAAVVDRRRVEMIAGGDPGKPPFVYHAAREMGLDDAARFVAKHAETARAEARSVLEEAREELRSKQLEVVASGILVGNRVVTAPLEKILGNHSLVHAAEGEMYRAAIRSACEGIGIRVVEVRVGELRARAADVLGIAPAKVDETLTAIGQAAGKPWAKDQKDACLAGIVSLERD